MVNFGHLISILEIWVRCFGLYHTSAEALEGSRKDSSLQNFITESFSERGECAHRDQKSLPVRDGQCLCGRTLLKACEYSQASGTWEDYFYTPHTAIFAKPVQAWSQFQLGISLLTYFLPPGCANQTDCILLHENSKQYWSA